MVVYQSPYGGGHKSLTRPNFQKNFVYLYIYVCVCVCVCVCVYIYIYIQMYFTF